MKQSTQVSSHVIRIKVFLIEREMNVNIFYKTYKYQWFWLFFFKNTNDTNFVLLRIKKVLFFNEFHDG